MINYNKGIMNIGDTARLKAAMKKAIDGGKVTVGFLGGSITQGSLSSTPETCYAFLVYRWWKEFFPKAEIKGVNAGIGATASNFGVARADEDLLGSNPDVVVVEYAVNDGANDFCLETYEGLVRHILSDPCEPAALQVLNTRYDNCESAEDKHLLVAKYYDIPSVSMKHSVYPEVANGNVERRDITPDDLHPNDRGHRMLADLIINFLDKVRLEVEEENANYSKKISLPKPLTQNGYENSKRFRNMNLDAKLEGFVADTSVQKDITDFAHYGYSAWKKGDRISFFVKASSIQLQYVKSVVKPAPIAKATIDGEKEVILDANFEETWGNCLYTESVLHHGEYKDHKVEIEIIKDHSDEETGDKVPFYLISVIASK